MTFAVGSRHRVSDQLQSRQPVGLTDAQRMTAETRAAAKVAAERAAEAKQRRQALAGALAGLAAVAVLIAGLVAIGGSDEPDSTAGSSASTAPSTAPDGTAANQGFPTLPEGADPALGQKPITSAGSGELTELIVTPLVEGTGAAAQAGQGITVNYVGVSYTTGEEFDASWNRSEPISFQLGVGNVIPGWDQGLVGVRVGSRVQLDIPSELAYGDNPGGGSPAGPLRFIVDVLALQ